MKATSNNDDLLLARRAACGSKTALDTLYRRYADPLFAFIYHSLGGRRPEAEDIFQDTWLAALRSLESFRGESGLFVWLCAIARHKVADLFPRCKRNRAGGSQDIRFDQLSASASPGSFPEDLVDRLDMRILVIEVLATLPDEYRTALLARYANDDSVQETALRLGKSYKATESLLSRARRAFRMTIERMDRERNHDEQEE
jgi:RNA polymerase sigma-70 factor (ECF subfamily)